MSNQSQTATVRKAFGKNLTEYGENVPAVLEVQYTFDSLTPGDDVPEDEALSAEDILDVINARRNATARAAAVNKALAAYDIKPPALSNDEKALNGLVRSLVLLGESEVDARAMAETIIASKKR